MAHESLNELLADSLVDIPTDSSAHAIARGYFFAGAASTLMILGETFNDPEAFVRAWKKLEDETANFADARRAAKGAH